MLYSGVYWLPEWPEDVVDPPVVEAREDPLRLSANLTPLVDNRLESDMVFGGADASLLPGM